MTTPERDSWQTPQLAELSVSLDTAFGEGSESDGGGKDPGSTPG